MTTPPAQRRSSIEEVLQHLPDAPVATTRDRGWTGVTLDLHVFAPQYVVAAPARDHHRPLAVAQPVGLQERFDGLLVVDDGERAGPVRAPQTAIETPGIEHAGQRVPDVREWIRLLG